MNPSTSPSKRLEPIVFKRYYFSTRQCLTCKETVPDGMYVNHAKTKHGTSKVEFNDEYPITSGDKRN